MRIQLLKIDSVTCTSPADGVVALPALRSPWLFEGSTTACGQGEGVQQSRFPGVNF